MLHKPINFDKKRRFRSSSKMASVTFLFWNDVSHPPIMYFYLYFSIKAFVNSRFFPKTWLESHTILEWRKLCPPFLCAYMFCKKDASGLRYHLGNGFGDTLFRADEGVFHFCYSTYFVKIDVSDFKLFCYVIFYFSKKIYWTTSFSSKTAK